MDLLHLIILGLVQGLTEFLPVSSSAHLILVPVVLGEQDQGLAFDVAAHVGSLIAVLFYFRRDLRLISGAWIRSGFRFDDPDGRMVWFLLAATLPVAAIGFLSGDAVDAMLREPLVIAAATIVFGVILLWADRAGRRLRGQESIGWRDAAVVGLAQVLALVPGTSRAGITMTAGLFLGLTREAAARFSFLLAIPVIVLAGGYESWKLAASEAPVDWTAVVIVTAVSAVAAGLTIHYFLRFLQFTGMLPYVIYRLILGAVLVFVFI